MRSTKRTVGIGRRLGLFVAVAMIAGTLHPASLDVEARGSNDMYVHGKLNPLFVGLPLSAREIAEERTEKSAVFDLGKGKRAAVSLGTPLFTEDDRERWVPIERNGRATGNRFVFDRLAAGVDIAFDLERPRYELTQNGRGYAVEFDADSAGAAVDERTVEYAVGDGLRLRWSVEGNRVRKEIVVEKKGAVHDMRFDVTPIDGVSIALESNRIVMRDGSGDIAFETVEPFLMTMERERLDEEVRIVRDEDGAFGYEFDEAELPLPYVLDPSEGPNDPGTLANDNSAGSLAWTNPSNAGASDNAYATASNPTSTQTHYLKATNFGFSIPDGSTIDGIVVAIERKCDLDGTENCSDNVVRLVKGGTISGDLKGGGGNWSTSDTTATYGADDDLWGITWTDSDIDASTFGVVVNVNLTNSGGGPG